MHACEYIHIHIHMCICTYTFMCVHACSVHMYTFDVGFVKSEPGSKVAALSSSSVPHALADWQRAVRAPRFVDIF